MGWVISYAAIGFVFDIATLKPEVQQEFIKALLASHDDLFYSVLTSRTTEAELGDLTAENVNHIATNLKRKGYFISNDHIDTEKIYSAPTSGNHSMIMIILGGGEFSSTNHPIIELDGVDLYDGLNAYSGGFIVFLHDSFENRLPLRTVKDEDGDEAGVAVDLTCPQNFADGLTFPKVEEVFKQFNIPATFDWIVVANGSCSKGISRLNENTNFFGVVNEFMAD